MSKILPNTRRKNFWEPIYDPAYTAPEKLYDWDTNTSFGVKDCVCTAEELEKKMQSENRPKWVMREMQFKKCDFRGNFNFDQIVFTDCSFENCDFGISSWENAKFTNCRFNRCSLTQTSFDKCQFNNCTWNDISFSGTETRIFNTHISNPDEFINAGYTNLDKGTYPANSKVEPAYQKMRLEETKAKVARTILRNNEQNGDDTSYYKAIKSYLLQTVKNRKESKIYEINSSKSHCHKLGITRFITNFWYSIEIFILKTSGYINGWGASIAKPFFLGMALMAIFAILYFMLASPNNSNANIPPFIAAIIKSFDITLLFGYTKHASTQSSICDQIVYGLNAIFGLWWYSILVPTVINRISRVR